MLAIGNPPWASNGQNHLQTREQQAAGNTRLISKRLADPTQVIVATAVVKARSPAPVSSPIRLIENFVLTPEYHDQVRPAAVPQNR